MDTDIINTIIQRLELIESKVEELEKHINPKKKNKNDDYQNINYINYDKKNDLYNIKTSQGSSLNIYISINEIKNMIDFLKTNESYILNNYSVITSIK